LFHLHGDGSGPVRAVAFHGWFGDGAGFASALAGVLDPERFSVAFLDYRGYGAARSSPGPFDLNTIAIDAIAAADQLGWDHFSLIGHSMGGKAALRTALEAAGRVERIIGITPVWAGAAPFDADTLGFFRSTANSPDARAALIDLTTGHRLPGYWVRRIAEHSQDISTRHAFAAYLEAWALDDFADEASTIDVPVQVIGGAFDQGIPPDWIRASWQAALPHVSVEIIENCGHYPMDECAPHLGRLIGQFLDPEGPR
jgi:pimeloyl-ACP methyl ester carboxylesterase